MKKALKLMVFLFACNSAIGQINSDEKHPPTDNPEVGTIIASVVNWDRFCHNANRCMPYEWSPIYSAWAPADGRSVPGSSYARVMGSPELPDLRGVFMRGINQFDDAQPSTEHPDPDGQRKAKNFQSATVFSYNGAEGSPTANGHARNQEPGAGMAKLHNHADREFRPANVAVYYYVRIN